MLLLSKNLNNKFLNSIQICTFKSLMHHICSEHCLRPNVCIKRDLIPYAHLHNIYYVPMYLVILYQSELPDQLHIVYALTFAGLNFRGLPIFTFFAFLFSQFVM